jgi:hypothetical protein
LRKLGLDPNHRNDGCCGWNDQRIEPGADQDSIPFKIKRAGQVGDADRVRIDEAENLRNARF